MNGSRSTRRRRRAHLEVFPTRVPGLALPLRIRWNAQAVPYIQARSDADAAYALGLVHAHLRGAQLQMMKRLAAGRVSEMVGPLAVDLDHALRILGLPRAAALAEEGVAASTRTWIDDFVRGLNDYLAQRPPRPPEYAWLGIKPEPFTRRDVLAIGRLAGADITWFVYLNALREHGKPGFDALWARMLRAGGGLPDAAGISLLGQVARFGSNSVAVSSQRSASRAPLLANDPHLGQTLPNFWILVGLQSPSYQMVGLMPPGLPFVGVGASEHGAWGGTNMHAASSDVVDVSGLPEQAFESEEVEIRVRWLGARKRRIRSSPQGPVISDARLLRTGGAAPLALRWAGYAGSDEIGAFLAVARARTPEQFHQAFANFAVSAQNVLFATRSGHIGKIHAARLPRRSGFEGGPVLTSEAAELQWREPWDALTLPVIVDPACGYLVSANERPAFDEPVLGFWYADSGRVQRLVEAVQRPASVTLEDLGTLQRDTVSPTAARVAAGLLELFSESGVAGAGVEALRGWKGDYAENSAAAVAFEAMLYALHAGMFVKPGASPTRFSGEWAYLNCFLLDDVRALAESSRHQLLERAAGEASARLGRFPRWGDQHRLRIAHLLRALPVVGRRFEIAEFPVGGSRDTPMKTAHGLTRGRHYSSYGAQARHLSDLSDLDENYFVLLGGNDGWWGSPQFADQVALWRRGDYIRMPLRADTIAAEFPTTLELTPPDSGPAD